MYIKDKIKRMKFIQTLVFACLIFTGMLTAQDEMSEMHIQMEISSVESSNPEAAAMLEMMKGTEYSVYHQDGKSLTNINMMGGMVGIKNIIDEEGSMNMFFDMMGNKMHVESTKLEMDKMKAENPNPLSDLDIEYDKEDTKTIAGYECYKMNVKSKDPDAGDFGIEAYVTEEININASVIQGVDLSEFAGFPLEYKLNMGQAILGVTTVELKDEVPAGAFDIETSGYKKMTMEEFAETMGAMGGGFGF
jgi:hypothetical protein